VGHLLTRVLNWYEREREGQVGPGCKGEESRGGGWLLEQGGRRQQLCPNSGEQLLPKYKELRGDFWGRYSPREGEHTCLVNGKVGGPRCSRGAALGRRAAAHVGLGLLASKLQIGVGQGLGITLGCSLG
jgi:hypothetical protein